MLVSILLGFKTNKQTFIDLWQPKAGLNNHSHIESLTYIDTHLLGMSSMCIQRHIIGNTF